MVKIKVERWKVIGYNPNESEADEISAVDQVLFNDYLLPKILTYLTPSELLQCRSVSPWWNVHSTNILLMHQSKSVIVLNSHDADGGASLYNSCSILKQDALKNFVKMVESSSSFPCNSFSIVGDLAEQHLQRFFWCHGSNVKNLALDIDLSHSNSPKLSMKLMEILLTRHLHNVENLVFLTVPGGEDINMKSSNIQLFSSAPTLSPLKKLKHLDMTGFLYLPEKFTRQILEAASNLEVFACHTAISGNVTLLLELNKIHLLKSFRFCFRPSRIDTYLEMSERNLQLDIIEGICLCQQDPELNSEVSKILSNCLYSSSSSLKCIHRFTPIGSFTFGGGLKFPQLPNLTHLGLENRGFSTERMFPPELNLAHTFSSLSTIEIQFSDSVFLLQPQEVFNSSSPMPSVMALSFHERTVNVPVNWVEYFSLLFPQLRVLHLHRVKNFLSTAHYIWNWSSLMDLELTIELDSSYCQYPHIEAAFTGFSLETCTRLYQSPQEVMDHEVDANLREYWSMLHLPNLMKLKVNFDCCACWDNSQDPIILSHVTGVFAFQMCPEVQVILVAKNAAIKASLEGVIPYVQSFSS